ncbi:glycerophosphodiester phosphodiesterase family protein [uncultured Ferrimonas sp.]|uniref:glycerophosphodiester phosphodiesterase n=1 Tax=uncultured Ferrimonas sp. TaxID=432640 RepID=UPI002621758C|nr:glycerophosphodiester phosphodiesterase family protein [uncultured Ferrimonas sp.]
MKIIAHRGASAAAIENTLAAMQLALEHGADAIELDVHLCQQQLVVFHDFSVNQLSNGRGQIAELTLAQLQALQLHPKRGSALAKTQPQLRAQIPTLWQVLEALADSGIDINIELKGANCAQALPPLLQQAEQRLGYRPEQFIISSFDGAQLQVLRQQTKRYPIGALTEQCPADLAQFASDLHAGALHANRRTITPALIDDAHQRGLTVYVYTVNSPTEVRRMAALGVDGIFTDHPKRSRELLQLTTSCQGWLT